MGVGTVLTSQPLLGDVENQARRVVTRCGDGDLVWHQWGTGRRHVVLVHGSYGSWTHWIRTVGPLSQHHTVSAVDLPGSGASAMPPHPIVDSVIEVIRDGLERVIGQASTYHLVGFSLGGALAGALAAIDDSRLASLTLVGPGGMPPVTKRVRLRRWRDEPNPLRRAALHRANLASLMIADANAIDDLAIRIQEQNAARGRLDGRVLKIRGVLLHALPRVRTPVSIIVGQRDATVAPHLSRRVRQLRELVPSASITVIPQAGHWVQYERAAEFNAVLLGIMRRIDAGKAET